MRRQKVKHIAADLIHMKKMNTQILKFLWFTTLSVAKIVWVLVIGKWVKMEDLWHVIDLGRGTGVPGEKLAKFCFIRHKFNIGWPRIEFGPPRWKACDSPFWASGRVAVVDCSWNVMAHGDAREGKWRGNWRMEWVASTLHTTSEHGVSSIITADAHTSVASSRLNWRPPPI